YSSSDGSPPTTTSSVYCASILLPPTSTLFPYTALFRSDVANATYAIQQAVAAAPTFSPGAGTYMGSVTVGLSTTTSGATIYYTTNGRTQTTTSSTYSAPILVSNTTTIQAIATASGMSNS